VCVCVYLFLCLVGGNGWNEQEGKSSPPKWGEKKMREGVYIRKKKKKLVSTNLNPEQPDS
jgi:hypothetical protein